MRFAEIRHLADRDACDGDQTLKIQKARSQAGEYLSSRVNLQLAKGRYLLKYACCARGIY